MTKYLAIEPFQNLYFSQFPISDRLNVAIFIRRTLPGAQRVKSRMKSPEITGDYKYSPSQTLPRGRLTRWKQRPSRLRRAFRHPPPCLRHAIGVGASAAKRSCGSSLRLAITAAERNSAEVEQSSTLGPQSRIFSKVLCPYSKR